MCQLPRWNLLSTAALNLFLLVCFENYFDYFCQKYFFVSGDGFARKDYFQRNSILTIFCTKTSFGSRWIFTERREAGRLCE